MNPVDFATLLRRHVDRLGTATVAQVCDVTPRTIQLWLNGQGNPNESTKAGALLLLGKTKCASEQNKP